MSAPRIGPVTYGQLSVLRSLKVHGPEGQSVANLISVWEVPLGVGTAQVIDAWLRLVKAHESLRTTYGQRDGAPVQIVHPFQPARLPTIELAEDTAEEAHRVATEWATDPFAVDRDLPWRAFVATDQGDPLYLVTVVHHVAADNDALRLLQTQFGELLEGAAVTPMCQPLDMAAAQREDPALRSVHHWAETWAELVDQDRHPDDSSERRRASLYSLEGLAAAKAISERLRISVQSVLFGVSALVIARHERRGRVTFALMAANRLDKRWAQLVGSLNQYAPVTVAVDETMPPLEFLRTTYVHSLTAYMNGAYDVDQLRENLHGKGIPEADPTAFAKHFNFLGAVDAEPDATSPLWTGVQWRQSTQRSGPNLHLAMAVGKGALIGVGASRNYLDEELPAVLAASIEAGLIAIARGDHDSLGQVSLEPMRTI